ncbi:hypothetical protein EAG_10175 [Camponotus floridanus]|uniref:Uncharacterized protein n=1 Tax=Camponotus floridanus TaxID=104421 RepID=E1ZVJ8_CAMFO|nr:hypothetical protein EAG_10175 [Camponotus floridanus]
MRKKATIRVVYTGIGTKLDYGELASLTASECNDLELINSPLWLEQRSNSGFTTGTLGPLPGYLAVLSTSSDLAIPDLNDITICSIRFFALHPWVGAILSLTSAIVRSKEPTQA